MALEEDPKFHKQAEKNLKNNLIDNVININDRLSLGCEKYSPFDIIIILGSLNRPSENLLSQLSNNGKLMICESFNSNLDESKLFVYTRINKSIYKEFICDLNLPRLNFDYEHKSIFKLEN